MNSLRLKISGHQLTKRLMFSIESKLVVEILHVRTPPKYALQFLLAYNIARKYSIYWIFDIFKHFCIIMFEEKCSLFSERHIFVQFNYMTPKSPLRWEAPTTYLKSTSVRAASSWGHICNFPMNPHVGLIVGLSVGHQSLFPKRKRE